MRRPRHLSPDERALWDHVVRQAQPLHKRRDGPAAAPAATPRPDIVVQNPPEVAPSPRFRIGEKVDRSRTNDLLSGLVRDMDRAAVRMDAKTHGRMKKGKLVPEARIDLHGMTLAQAHPALLAFVLGSHRRGLRLILVITGKGRAGDDVAPLLGRSGILRQQVPHWLSLPPLAQVVLQVAPAHVTHGGGGAWYVYLRRAR